MPTKKRLRRRVLVLILVVIGLVGLSTPAFADPPELQVTVSADTAVPGQIVTVTATFTNIQSTPVQFVYESLSPDYYTQMGAGIFTFLSCTGDDTWCSLDGTSVEWHDNPPIAPGASQTVTLTYQIAANSPCGSSVQPIRFNIYNYDEYNSGLNAEGGTSQTSETWLLCS